MVCSVVSERDRTARKQSRKQFLSSAFMKTLTYRSKMVQADFCKVFIIQDGMGTAEWPSRMSKNHVWIEAIGEKVYRN